MKRRGLLLDRDGVINIDHGYVGRREQFEFMPGVFPFLRAAQDMGFRLAILTNQSGVARELYTEKDYDQLTRWMLAELARARIHVELTLACFDHSEGTISTYRRESFWRKPNPGMVLEAIQRLNLDPAHSVFLGDKMTDMEAAQAGGIRKRLMLADMSDNKQEGVSFVRSFDEAIKALQTI